MRGGKREGAGRKKSAITTKVRELAVDALNGGQTPLDFLMSVMRDETNEKAMRIDAAKAAAAYVHPRLAAVDHSGSMTLTTQEQALNEIEQATSQIEADGKPN